MSNTKLEHETSHLAEKLQQWMRLKGYNVPALSKMTGITTGGIHKILSGQSNPTYFSLKALADALEIKVSALTDETEPNSKRVCLISWSEILDFMNAPVREVKNYSFCLTDEDVGVRAFALNVIGEGYPPRFVSNTTLIFDPDVKPFDRSYVLVQLADSYDPILKQLLIDDPKKYIKSLNPELKKVDVRELEPNEVVLATLVSSICKHYL